MSNVHVIERASNNQVILSLTDKLYSNNIICISGEITNSTAYDFRNQILYIISLNPDNKIINIFIDSPGGSAYAFLSIYDMIKYAQDKGFKVATICTGIAMSAAFGILISGTKGYRKALPHSTIMMHQLSGGTFGNIQDMEVDYKECQRLNDIFKDIVESQTSITDFKGSTIRDAYVTPEEAIHLGIIDIILNGKSV